MPASAQLALLTLWVAVAPVMAQPLKPEQASLLEQAREAAMRYSASLPDFLCTELVRRADDPQGHGHFRPADTLTVKLSYSGHREEYRLTQVDGRPTLLDYTRVAGSLGTGEFGTRMYSLFDPRSQGDFRWRGWTTLRKRRVARFWYRIGPNESNFVVRYGPVRQGWEAEDQVPEGRSAMIVAYHGDVWVDEETHLVLRYTHEAEIPHGFPITANISTVDYDFAEVAGRRYLLPSHALITTRMGNHVAENKVEFREYRKFQTDSSITFDPPPGKQ
jgi:hypothetical protein